MEDPAKILRERGVEIDLSDHRTPREIAVALGMIASAAPQPGTEPQADSPVELAKRPKDSPYLAY